MAAAFAAAQAADWLDEATRGRLAIALEQHIPKIVVTGAPGVGVHDVMAELALNRVVAVRGDLSMRPTGPYDPTWWQAIGQYVLHGDALVALDIIGAWADAYARLPGTPWLQDAEEAFLDDVAQALIGSAFAVSGREIIRREELGAAVLVDEPVAALITNVPALAEVDRKLQEALRELEHGRPADAVTDAGTALQMLLEHLGYTGKQLGDQVTAARKAGWLSGLDTQLGKAVEAIAQWVASVRNQRGDAHHGPDPDPKDAEFVVRMVGLLLLRFGA